MGDLFSKILYGEILSFPRSGEGMPTVTLPRHATLERCRMNSHSGAWESGVSWEDIFCMLPKLSLAGLSCLKWVAKNTKIFLWFFLRELRVFVVN